MEKITGIVSKESGGKARTVEELTAVKNKKIRKGLITMGAAYAAAVGGAALCATGAGAPLGAAMLAEAAGTIMGTAGLFAFGGGMLYAGHAALTKEHVKHSFKETAKKEAKQAAKANNEKAQAGKEAENCPHMEA